MGLCGKIEKGLVFIVSAPAGAGKTTLVEMLLKEFPGDIERSVSCTTREPRDSEISGRDYIFIDSDDFQKKIKNDEFLEFAKVFSNYYGTLKKTVYDIIDQGKHAFLVIDTQGAFNLRHKIDAFYIFIMPPSIEELQTRLKIRDEDTDESIKERLSWAKDEMKKSQEFDVVIENSHLDEAYSLLKKYIKKTEKNHCKYI